MTTLTLVLELTDAQATGIAQARTAYNATLPEDATPITDTEYLEYVLINAANSYSAQYSGSEPVPPSPVEPIADWTALQTSILGGALYPIYARLTAASFTTPDATLAQIANANNIAVAAGKLDQAVAVTRVEAAVAASFQLLITTSNYTFTQEEKDIWNPLVESLNFSELMYLP